MITTRLITMGIQQRMERHLISSLEVRLRGGDWLVLPRCSHRLLPTRGGNWSVLPSGGDWLENLALVGVFLERPLLDDLRGDIPVRVFGSGCETPSSCKSTVDSGTDH